RPHALDQGGSNRRGPSDSHPQAGTVVLGQTGVRQHAHVQSRRPGQNMDAVTVHPLKHGLGIEYLMRQYGRAADQRTEHARLVAEAVEEWRHYQIAVTRLQAEHARIVVKNLEVLAVAGHHALGPTSGA